jgi:hypothetical protein
MKTFPQGMLTGQGLQPRNQLIMTAQLQHGVDLPFRGLQPQFLQARHFFLEQLPGRNVGQRRTAPQAQRFTQQPVRAIPGFVPQRSAAVAAQAAEPQHVHLGAEPALVARLVTRLAAGDADRLSGCHLSVHDDLDAILACGEDVRDRYQLRRAGTPKRRAETRVMGMSHLQFVARGRKPDNSREQVYGSIP